MERLRAVLLDAGGTLIHPDHDWILERLAEEGVEATAADYEAARRRADTVIGDILRSDDPGTDQTRIRTWFATILLTMGLPDDRLAAVAGDIRARHEQGALWVRPVPGTRAMLESLQSGGLRLAVISNADGRVADYLARAGLADLFEFILDSAVEGVEKPDPEIFRRALDRLGLGPDEVVYVGDTWTVDVIGARRAGIQPVYLEETQGGSPPSVGLEEARGGSLPPGDAVIRIDGILDLPGGLGLADAEETGNRRESA